MSELRYILLQVRNSDDAMRAQEIGCFSRALACDASAIDTFDLLAAAPTRHQLDQVDMVLLGGSGHYSVASEGQWLEWALDAMRELHHLGKPTFASCWGFQAMARAMGGTCVRDTPNAELGTVDLWLTDAGRRDPLFSQLPPRFGGQAGHEDHVIELPEDAVLLASSDRVAEQAFRFADLPIYCTQFHPELDVATICQRARNYPEYIERIVGVPPDEFPNMCRETPEANTLLKRFVKLVFGDNR